MPVLTRARLNDATMKTLTVLAAACLSALALAACGSSSGDAGASGTTADDRDTARLKLQECLRKQGVELPRPGSGGSRPSSVDLRKVQEALQGPCKSVAQGAFGTRTPEQRQEFQDRMAKFSSCMRKHGVEIPAFTPGQGPPVAARRIDRDDPKVRAAMDACRSVLPGGGRGGGPGGGPDVVVGGGPS